MERRWYTIQIDGITPLVMHNPQSMLAQAEANPRDKGAWEREHYQEMLYRRDEDRLYVPAAALKKMLMAGCKFIPDKPKRFLSFSPFLDASMLIDEDALLDVPLALVKPWGAVVNLDPSKGPRGPRGIRTRPLISPPWHAETSALVWEELLTTEILQKIAETAGLSCGLLDARSLGYGRCTVGIVPRGR